MSTDQTYAQRVFKESLGGLPYELGSDWMREVSRKFGVLKEEGGYAARSVFIIDRTQKVIFENRAFEAGNRQHYEEVIAALPTP